MKNWIEINLPYGPIYESSSFEELDSFSKRELNKPGSLIKMEDGEYFLIGDINKLSGICDDCTEFSKNSIVVSYKVLLTKDDLK